MLVLGLIAEAIIGVLLGLTVPHAGRKAELALSTVGVVVVLLVTGFMRHLQPMDAITLLMGWLSVAIGMSLGKSLRLHCEVKYFHKRLAVVMPMIKAFFMTCDAYVHGTGTKAELDDAWHSARNALGNFATLSALYGVIDEVHDLTGLLAEDGLTDQEEAVWQKTVTKAAEMATTIA